MKLSQTPWGELGDPNAWISWDHVQPSKALTLFLCSVLRSADPLGSEFLEGRVISYSTLYSQCLV